VPLSRAPQVILRRHIEHGVCAMPRSVKLHRIAESFDVFGFSLEAEEVAAIDLLDTGVRGDGPDPELLATEPILTLTRTVLDIATAVAPRELPKEAEA